jgi:tetratricopeptide (TPR) repeat protein
MKTIAIALLNIIILLNTLYASTAENIFNEANALYHNKKYKEALNLYNKLENEGYNNAALYYNKGNAHYKLHEIGMAIWCFEKTLAINPQFTDACKNLTIANAHLIDKIENNNFIGIIAQWQSWLASLNQHLIVSLAILFSFIWLILLILFYIKYRNKLILFKSSFVFLILSIFAYCLSYATNSYKTEHSFAIITNSNIYIKSAPDEGAVNLVLIHEGHKVEVIDKQFSWYKIKLLDGKSGWIAQDGLIVI